MSKKNNIKKVCVIGLGFVGSAMSIAISSAEDSNGNHLFDVVGIDKDSELGLQRINSLNNAIFPFPSRDKKLKKYLQLSIKTKKNFRATSHDNDLETADVVIVDINLDVLKLRKGYEVNLESFLDCIKNIGSKINKSCLVIIETTVPPGATSELVLPMLKKEFLARGIADVPLLAHSYERVMPGPNYFDSIKNFPRVYSATSKMAKTKASKFFKNIINGELSFVHSTTASEMAKVLENSYRAMNIAFIEEWTLFAEKANVNLYEILSNIKKRTTHSNIMSPGLGVGGYCLTKDSLLADWSSQSLFRAGHLSASVNAVEINDNMPKNIYSRIKDELVASGCNVLLLGLSYLPDVGDERSSPSGILHELLRNDDFKVEVIDEYLNYWHAREMRIHKEPLKESYDAIILATPHKKYLSKFFLNKLNHLSPNLIIDCWGKYKNSDFSQATRFIQVGNGAIG